LDYFSNINHCGGDLEKFNGKYMGLNLPLNLAALWTEEVVFDFLLEEEVRAKFVNWSI